MSTRANSSSTSSNSRAGSGRSSRGATPQVESAVTRLLVAIKALLEELTLWSNGRKTETDVSDVYVRLGNDFNTCIVAFAAYDIDMRELRNVPEELREVLQTCLAEDANPETLEKYLPEVRKIITDLLQGLRNKQSLFRQKVQDRALRKSERQDSAASTQRGLGRSSSKPRPAAPSRIPEEELSPPPLPNTQFNQPVPPPPSNAVASAIPERISLGRRRYSGPRAQSPLSAGSDSESAPARFVGGFAGPRAPSIAASSAGDAQGLADLVANASAAEERLKSPASRKTPLPSHSRATSSGKSDKEAPIDSPFSPPDADTSGRSSATITPPKPTTPPRPQNIHVPSVSPDVKRYSLSDKPLSPTKPSVNIVASTPSPPTVSSVTVDGQGAISPPLSDGFTESTPSPAVEKSLAALQQSDILARKASKRFSSWEISKMGASVGGSQGLAGNTLASGLQRMTSSKSMNRRSLAQAASIAHLTPKDLEALAEVDEPTSPHPQRMGSINRSEGKENKNSRSTTPVDAPPLPTHTKHQTPTSSRSASVDTRQAATPSKAGTINLGDDIDTPAAVEVAEASPPRADAMTVFLQVGKNVKKVTLGADTTLSYSSLRVLFVDKFSYNPGQDNFPAIYIRDANAGIQYELEDMDEVTNGCLLSLNIEPLDQVKQHIDIQMAALTSEIKDLRTAINSQKRASFVPPVNIPDASPVPAPPPAPRPSEQQIHMLARRLSKFRPDGQPPNYRPVMQPLVEQNTGSTYQPLIPQSTGGSSFTMTSESGATTRIVSDLKSQFDEIQNLRRDLGVMRQLYVGFISQTKESLSALRTQTTTVKDLANTKVGGARAYITSGKANLDSRTQSVLTKIEDLQDTVENLRDDVLKRHISPKSSILKTLKADIEKSQEELQALQDHIAAIKPMWKKTWEEELQNIVEEQQFLTHQEEFIGDLIEDHKAVTEVFGHVEKVVNLRSSNSSGSRFGGVVRTGKSFRPPPPEPGHDGLSTVILEIRGKQPDSSIRLKAIEAAQSARKKQLNARSDEFTDELDDFVSQKKLKQTGGIEETERLRQARNDYALKNMFTPASGGVAGGTMINAQLTGSSVNGSSMNGFGDGGAGLGMAGLSFAKAPAIVDDDYTGGGGGGFGMAGLSFAKAPPIPDSP